MADAMFSNEFMKMCPIEGKGLGLIATKSIPAGTRILAEEPIFGIDTEGTQTNKEVLTLCENRLAIMSTSDREAYLNLNNALRKKKISPAYGIFLTNAIPVDSTRPGYSNIVLEVFCRVNHSCLPNADHSWDDDKGKMNLHTIHAVNAGDEITIDYFGSNPQFIREHKMREMGFKCTCAICTLPPAQLAARENRRIEIHDLKKRLNEMQVKGCGTEPGPCDCLPLCRRLIDLYREMGAIDMGVVEIYRFAYRRAAAHASATRARVFASRALARAVILLGDDQPLVKQLQRYKDDPKADLGYALAVAEGIPEEQPGEVKDVEDPDFEDWLWTMNRGSVSPVVKEEDSRDVEGALITLPGTGTGNGSG